MPSIASFVLPVIAGLLANLAVDLILARRYRSSFALDTPARKTVRILRWIIAIFGLCLAHAVGLASLQILVIGLLTVTAGTDVEHLRLPPSPFIYAATLAGVLTAYWVNGVAGLQHAIVAQAVWFALMTLSVMLLRRTAGGDIKVVMQYGAACGSLSISFIGMLLASSVMIPFSLIYWLRHHRPIPRTPLAPLVWLGALAGLILEKLHVLP
jgi:hypothetical protein